MPGLLDRMQPAKASPLHTPPSTPGSSPPAPPKTEAMEPAAPSPTVDAPEPVDSRQKEIRRKLALGIAAQLLAGMNSANDPKREDATALHERFQAVLATAGDRLAEAGIRLSPEDLQQLEREVMYEVQGLGPLEPLLRDPTITEIMVNGPQHVFIERKGQVTCSDVQFENDAHIMRVVERILRPLGRRVDRKWPMADARLPDGSRVNIIVPPSAIDGPTITIRKFSKQKLTVEDLIRFGSLTPSMAEFLRACVIARLNIIVSGGTGSGKTTLLNVLSNFIPDHDRVVTIEDSAELQLAKPHVVRLEARPPDPDGTGRVTIRDLVVNALRMRPERIVVGEVRDAAALDMLQAMNTGHDGSLTTLHANTPRDAMSRLETLTLMAGIEFPIKVVREQIAAAIDLIVQQARLRDGSRKIVQITEVQGMEGDIIVLQDVFRFVERGLDAEGKVLGDVKGSGIPPKFLPRLESAGVPLPRDFFATSTSSPQFQTPHR